MMAANRYEKPNPLQCSLRVDKRWGNRVFLLFNIGFLFCLLTWYRNDHTELYWDKMARVDEGKAVKMSGDGENGVRGTQCYVPGSVMLDTANRAFYCQAEESEEKALAENSNSRYPTATWHQAVKGNNHGDYAIITAWGDSEGVGGYNQMGTMTSVSKIQYCELHGYAFYRDNDMVRENMSWNEKAAIRTRAIRRHMTNGKHRWIWWADSDIMIVNPHENLESLCTEAEGYDIVMSKDWGDMQINDGSFLIRASKWSLDFLERWEKAINTHESHDDQISLIDLIKEDPSIEKHIKFVPQHRINSYPQITVRDKSYGPHTLGMGHDFYQPGDFVVHIINCLRDQRTHDAQTCLGVAALYFHIFRTELDAAWRMRTRIFAQGGTIEDVRRESKKLAGRPPPHPGDFVKFRFESPISEDSHRTFVKENATHWKEFNDSWVLQGLFAELARDPKERMDVVKIKDIERDIVIKLTRNGVYWRFEKRNETPKDWNLMGGGRWVK